MHSFTCVLTINLRFNDLLTRAFFTQTILSNLQQDCSLSLSLSLFLIGGVYCSYLLLHFRASCRDEFQQANTHCFGSIGPFFTDHKSLVESFLKFPETKRVQDAKSNVQTKNACSSTYATRLVTCFPHLNMVEHTCAQLLLLVRVLTFAHLRSSHDVSLLLVGITWIKCYWLSFTVLTLTCSSKLLLHALGNLLVHGMIWLL